MLLMQVLKYDIQLIRSEIEPFISMPVQISDVAGTATFINAPANGTNVGIACNANGRVDACRAAVISRFSKDFKNSDWLHANRH